MTTTILRLTVLAFGTRPHLPLAMRRRCASLLVVLGVIAVISLAALIIGLPTRPLVALPTFARQTGQPCAACHTAFPELTPFGRRFKLGGYTMGGGLTFEQAPPIAAMLIPTFTHTERNQDTPPASGTHTNNNTVLQQASVFYGGTIYGNLGALVQTTFDRATNRVFLDNSDVRYAAKAEILGLAVLYVVKVNNH